MFIGYGFGGVFVRQCAVEDLFAYTSPAQVMSHLTLLLHSSSAMMKMIVSVLHDLSSPGPVSLLDLNLSRNLQLSCWLQCMCKPCVVQLSWADVLANCTLLHDVHVLQSLPSRLHARRHCMPHLLQNEHPTQVQHSTAKGARNTDATLSGTHTLSWPQQFIPLIDMRHNSTLCVLLWGNLLNDGLLVPSPGDDRSKETFHARPSGSQDQFSESQASLVGHSKSKDKRVSSRH